MIYTITRKEEISSVVDNLLKDDSIYIPVNTPSMITEIYSGYRCPPKQKYVLLDNKSSKKYLYSKSIYEICQILHIPYNDKINLNIEKLCKKYNCTITNSDNAFHRSGKCKMVPHLIFCPFCHQIDYYRNMVQLKESKAIKDMVEELSNKYNKTEVKEIIEELSIHNFNLIKRNSKTHKTILKCSCCEKTFDLSNPIKLSYSMNPIFVPNKIYIKNKNDKITINFYGVYYNSLFNSSKSLLFDNLKLSVIKAKGTVSMNLKTGQTYILPMRSAKGHILHRKRIYNTNHPTNITYPFYQMNIGYDVIGNENDVLNRTFSHNELVLNVIYNIIAKKYSLEMNSFIFNKYIPEENFRLLILKNRYPYFSIEEIKNILYKQKELDCLSDDLKTEITKLKSLNRDSKYNEQINNLIIKHNIIYSPYLTQKIKENLFYTVIIDHIIKSGFTSEYIISSVFELYLFFSKKDCINNNFLDLIKKLIASNSEEFAFDFLSDINLNRKSNMIYSLSLMFKIVYHSSYKEELLSNLSHISSDYLDVYNSIRDLYDKMKYEQNKISYSIREIAEYNNISGDYKFKLINSTFELIRVGQKLGVNIASRYCAEFLAKEYLIIAVYNSYLNMPLYYIIISPKSHYLLEVKAAMNKKVMMEDAEALIEWINDLKKPLKTNYCGDFYHIDSGAYKTPDTSIGIDTHSVEIDCNDKIRIIK